MKYQAKGTIKVIYPTAQITDTFKKREFVLVTQDGQYSEEIKFQTTGDRTALLDNFAEGQEVTVHFNLKGRGYPAKDGSGTNYFTNLDAWFIQGQAQPSAQAQSVANAINDSDDLPF